MRPVRLQYAFAWKGLTGATADLHLSKSAEGQYVLESAGRTVGLVRSLWKFDGRHRALTDARTLRPIEIHEVESERAKTWETTVTYNETGAISHADEREGAKTKSKTRTFDFPHVMSLSSSLLYLRSLPLADGAVERVLVYPAKTAYLCTATVLGRERIDGPTGSYPAIKLDLQLAKIDKKREPQPHKKFKRGAIWISDDADRLVLRIEAQMHIGTVSAELQSVR